MELTRKLYSIEETERLLSLPAKELGILTKDGELRTETMFTAQSILEYAKRKRIALTEESAR